MLKIKNALALFAALFLSAPTNAVTVYETADFATSQDCQDCVGYKSAQASGFTTLGEITLAAPASIDGVAATVIRNTTTDFVFEVWSRDPTTLEPSVVIDSIPATIASETPGTRDVNGESFDRSVSRVLFALERGTQVLAAGTYYFSIIGQGAGDLRLSSLPGALWFRVSTNLTNFEVAYPTPGEVPVSLDGTPYVADGSIRPFYELDPLNGNSPGQLFTPDSYFNKRQDWRPSKTNSGDLITYLEDKYPGSFLGYAIGASAIHGHTEDQLFVSSLMSVNDATANLQDYSLDLPNYFVPDCDTYRMPTPEFGRVNDPLNRPGRTQNNAGYANIDGGDSHVYVRNLENNILYEAYKSHNMDLADKADRFTGCTRLYDLSKRFDNSKDIGCTSTNAAGVAHSPFFVTPEFRAHDHMIAFTLPNAYVERNSIHRPGTHNPLQTANGWGPPDAGPGTPFCYACIVVLREDWVPPNGATLGPVSQRIVDTLKTHGMQHIDGSSPGQIVLSNDYFANIGWWQANGGPPFSPFELSQAGLRWTDFRVIEPFGTDPSETKFIYAQKPDCTRPQQGDFTP